MLPELTKQNSQLNLTTSLQEELSLHTFADTCIMHKLESHFTHPSIISSSIEQ